MPTLLCLSGSKHENPAQVLIMIVVIASSPFVVTATERSETSCPPHTFWWRHTNGCCFWHRGYKYHSHLCPLKGHWPHLVTVHGDEKNISSVLHYCMHCSQRFVCLPTCSFAKHMNAHTNSLSHIHTGLEVFWCLVVAECRQGSEWFTWHSVVMYIERAWPF